MRSAVGAAHQLTWFVVYGGRSPPKKGLANASLLLSASGAEYGAC